MMSPSSHLSYRYRTYAFQVDMYQLLENISVGLEPIDPGNFRHYEVNAHTWQRILMQGRSPAFGNGLEMHKVLGSSARISGLKSLPISFYGNNNSMLQRHDWAWLRQSRWEEAQTITSCSLRLSEIDLVVAINDAGCSGGSSRRLGGYCLF